MSDFEPLGLSEETLKAIKECGYTTPTPIQAQAIPAILMMRDVIGLAQTGTGKTAGFTLPMIDILSGGRAKAKMPRSLILSPTRELAAQIAENFEQYGKHHALNMALLTGGSSMGEQIKKLERGVDVLIATPGRLLDLFERGQILLNDIKILVIDEADRMLDMGFIPDIEKIMSLLPASRQTLLFSATMPGEIKRLISKFLSNPKEISVAPPASPAETVEQIVLKTTARNKRTTLLNAIKSEHVKNAYVFCNRKRDIGDLTAYLKKQGLKAGALHGDMVQAKRTETLDAFREDEIIFLVCSDVVARGIDIQGVSHVFNYDVPINADDYIHRIGRTGRAGQSGRAVMLYVPEKDDKFLENIQKLIGRKFDLESSLAQQSAKPEASGKTEKSEKKPQAPSAEKRAQKTASKDQKPKPKKPSKQPRKGSNRDSDDDPPVGFGNDMPDFFKQA